MKINILYFLILVFVNLFSQENVLISISNSKVSANDFMQNYYKNKLDTDTLDFSDSLKEYLDLYVKFKLKVVEAEKMGLDTLPNFLRELEGYRRQLVKPYLTDVNVSDQLLEEAYERLKYEVSASHILIRTDDANDNAAYEKALSIKKRLNNGESFLELAQQFSEDPSVKDNNGDLGYFSALYMVYPFESAAYNTDVGSISDVIETRFGYHILKINDKRPSRGEVKVAHILISNKDNSDDKNKIYEIYDSLMLGANFSTLAKQYSDDKKSGNNGGELEWFGANKMVKEFEEIAFSIDSVNTFSQPFETDFGWHIIKLLDKKYLPPFSEIQESLKKRVERDSRSQKTRDVVLDRLKDEWGFVENINAKTIFYNLVNEEFLSGSDISKNIKDNGHVMFLFNNCYNEKERYVFQQDFITFLNSFRSRLNSKVDFNKVVDELYSTFKEQKILDLESNNLQYKYDDFRLLYNEYHDGILMYQLQKEKVWDKAIADTSGLVEFYDNNKSNYMWSNRIVVKKYFSNDSRIHSKVNRKIKWGSSDDQILRDINRSSALNLSIKENTYSQGDDQVIDELIYNKNFEDLSVGDIFMDNENNTIFYIVDLLPASVKKIDEIKGIVISDYQSFLEKVWLEELRQKHTVVVNGKLFSQMQTDGYDSSGFSKNHASNHIENSFLRKDFSFYFSNAVAKLGASKDVFFGWNGEIYTTEIKPHGEE